MESNLATRREPLYRWLYVPAFTAWISVYRAEIRPPFGQGTRAAYAPIGAVGVSRTFANWPIRNCEISAVCQTVPTLAMSAMERLYGPRRDVDGPLRVRAHRRIPSMERRAH